MVTENIYHVVGRITREAMQRKKNKPPLDVMEYMLTQLEEAKIHNLEPNWEKISKESRKIWRGNL